MRLLWLTQSYEVHAFDLLADSLRKHMEVDFLPLNAEEQKNLRKIFSRIDFLKYDRIMTTLRTKKEMRQWKTMKGIPNHVIFEYDACQNYMPSSKYKGKFSLYYERLDSPTIIVSGATVAKRLKDEGFESYFLPKGYDPRVIQDKKLNRDIRTGFIGSLGNDVYSQRREMIKSCQDRFSLELFKTHSLAEYAEKLNRIKFFISADIGLGEYMAKNFEAMGAGCILFTYNQGEYENKALGFVDMKNVVLYKTLDELDMKFNILLNDDDLSNKIAESGKMLARENFAYDKMGLRLANILKNPILTKKNDHKRGKLSFKALWR
ncbi:MAG: glycosyltransferase [Desulfuromonadaceae bacterium]